MASDTEHEEPPPYDEEDADQLTPSAIPLGFELLVQPQSFDDWAETLSQLILLAPHMDNFQLWDLAQAVKRGPKKREKGSPKKEKRLKEVIYFLSWTRGDGPWKLPSGLKGLKAGEAISAIAERYKIEPAAARKLYEQAVRAASGEDGK